jgi:hypothetical protein
MECVVIIDEKQLVLSNVVTMMTSLVEDKFVIRFETGNGHAPDDVTDEEILDRIIDGSAEFTEVVESTPESTVVETSQDSPAPVLQFSAVKSSPSPSVAPHVHPAFQPQVTPAMVKPAGSVRVHLSVEPPKTVGTRATFGSAVIGVSREQRKHVVQDAPASQGIIMPDKDSTLVGKSFSIAVDHALILNKMRRDLGVQLVYESEIGKMKNLKTNLTVKSEPFGDMSDALVRFALQTLATHEQDIARARDRENKLFVDVKPVLVVESIVDEVAGTGLFHFEEVVSVYENPETLLSKVDNGKD